MHVRSVIVEFNLMAAVCETPFVMIPDDHSRMVIQVIKQVGADPPQYDVSLNELVIKIANSCAPQQLNFPVLGKTVIEPDCPKMRGDAHILEIILRSMQLRLPKELVRRREIPQSEHGARREPMDGLQMDS